nr:hypothetical protein [Escherichia coli]
MATNNTYPVYDGNFFQATHDIILRAIEKSTSGMFDNYINIAYTLGKYGVSIYVLWYGFTVLARKQQTPVPDFIWNTSGSSESKERLVETELLANLLLFQS